MAAPARRRKSSLPNLNEAISERSQPHLTVSPGLAGREHSNLPFSINPNVDALENAYLQYENRIHLSGSFDKHYHSDTELMNPQLQEYFWKESSESSDAQSSSRNSISSSSDDYSKQFTCLSDKTLDCGTVNFQNNTNTLPGRTFRHRRRCRLCFREQCYGCRYFIGYSKGKVFGVRTAASLPNIIRDSDSLSGDHKDSTKRRKFTTKQKTSLVCLGLVDLTAFLSMSIIAPFFPYEASLKNMRESVAGLVFSIYALVTMLTSPFFGKIAPHVGVKFLYLSGILVAGVSNILFGFLVYIEDNTLFAVFCFVVRAFEALGAAAFSTASNIIILNTFPDDIGTVFGLVETCVGIGMSIGPAVGGGLYSLGGYGLPFYILGSVVLLNIPLTWFLLDVPEEKYESSGGSSYKDLLSISRVILISIVVVVASQAQGFIDPTLEPHFRQFNLSPGIVGLLFLILAASYALSSPVVGFITGKYEVKYPMMLAGLTLMTLALLLLGPSPFLPLEGGTLWLSILAIVLMGISFACAFIPTFEAIFDEAIDGGMSDDLGTYSIVSGLWTSMYSLGEVTGPTLGGVLSDFLDFPQGSTTMAICCFLTALLICGSWCWFRRKERRNSVPELDSGISDNSKDSNEDAALLPAIMPNYGTNKTKVHV